MAEDIQVDRKARFCIAHGLHPVKGYRLNKRVELAGNNKEVYVRMGLGLDEWDACLGLYYNGNQIAAEDFVFHAGGPVDVADAFFPGETYPGAAYVNVRLRGAFAEDEDPENIEGIYRTLKIADYNGAGQQIDENGDPLPVGAMPRDYYFYSANPARQMVDLILRWGLRKATTIDWPEWADWKADCAEQIEWDDGEEVRMIPRFESHLFYLPPFRLTDAMRKIAEVSCADWQRAHGKLYFMPPHAREPVFTFDLAKLPEGAFKFIGGTRQYNQVLVYFRDLDTPYLTPAGEEGAAPIVDIERPLAANEVRRALEINLGGAYASQAKRVGEYAARINCDLYQSVEFEGSPDSFAALPADVIALSDIVPTWDGVQFKIYEKEESEDTKPGYLLTGMLYNPNAYSDTEHGPVERPLPPSDPDRFAAPPHVADVTLAERNILQADQTVVTILQVTAEFSPYVNKQVGRVWYKKSSEDWSQAKDGGTIDPAIDTLTGSLEIRGVEKTTYNVKVVPESSFASAGIAGATPHSLLITGKVTLPAEPATHTAVYNALSRQIEGSFPASTDGDVQAYLLYVVIGGVDTFVKNLGNSRAYSYTPPSNWSAAITLKVFTLNWSGWMSAAGRAASPVSPPALTDPPDLALETKFKGRQRKLSWAEPADMIHVKEFEVYADLAGGIYDPPDTDYPNYITGGTPSNLVYKGTATEYFLPDDGPFANDDIFYLRKVGYFGNVSRWRNTNLPMEYSGSSSLQAKPTISVDATNTTQNLIKVNLSTSILHGSVLKTIVQIRQHGGSWSTAGQVEMDGLCPTVLVPWLRGGIVEMRAMLAGAPDSNWSDTLTHNTYADMQASAFTPAFGAGTTADSIAARTVQNYTFSLPGVNTRDIVSASPAFQLEAGLQAGPPSVIDDGGTVNIPISNITNASVFYEVREWNVHVTKRRSGNPDLLRSLVAHWRLNERSGTRYDAHGANHLADNNTVTNSDQGKLGYCALFTRANSEYLSIADNAALSMGDIDCTFAAWVYLNSQSASQDLLGKISAIGSNSTSEYALRYNLATDTFRFLVIGSDDNAAFVDTGALGAATGIWLFIIAWHDSVANTLNIRINNGTVSSTSHTMGIKDAAAGFALGRPGDFNGNYLDARLDSVSIWKRVLTSAERTALYAAGAGLDYPF